MQLNFEHLFPQLPVHSRVWLFLADRKLTSVQLTHVMEKLDLFLKSWSAHGNELSCDGTILFSQYLILAVDEQVEHASGCSIDSATNFVKSIGKELGIDFFNRLLVLEIDGEELTTSNYFEAVKSNKRYLNPLAQTLEELRYHWIFPSN